MDGAAMAAPFCFEGDAVRRQGSKEPRETVLALRIRGDCASCRRMTM
jgi:hypothetical protein